MITPRKKLLPILERMFGPLTFGMFLQAARTRADASQADFAKKLKISRGTLCDIEKGRQLVSVALAVKIARKLQISEKMAIMTCLQDQVSREKIKMRVELKAANE